MSRSSSEAPPENGHRADDFGELRNLLIGPEEAEIRELKERLDNPRRFAEEVGKILAPALRHSAADGQKLEQELGPPVEKAVRAFIRDDPNTVADAIFPAIGPAVRKSIAASLRGLVQSINRTLEHSLTIKGFKWRLEARRSGRTFAEVVLLHSLVYRVEQVFLIHRETGLLLEHVVAESIESPDADVISAMLTAIQDFVQDSFEGPRGQELDSLQLGDLTVLLERGPRAVLAAVVRGQPPIDLREELIAAVEDVHREFGDRLDRFDGDSSAFAACRPRLERCLAAQYETDDDATMALPKWFWVVFVTAVIGVSAWSWLTLQARWRWQDYLETLARQPGVVVTEAKRTSLRGGVVSGLRDPLAPEPGLFVERAGLEAEKMSENWQPYQSLEPTIVLARARQILAPPEGVELELDDGRLVVGGVAARVWLAATQSLARAIPGVREVVVRADIDDTAQLAFHTALASIDGRRLHFDAKSTEPREDLAAVAAEIVGIERLANELGKSVEMTLVGRTDETGASVANVELSLQRARSIHDRLRSAGVKMTLDIDGRGSFDPLPAPGDRRHGENRSVTLQLRVSG